MTHKEDSKYVLEKREIIDFLETDGVIKLVRACPALFDPIRDQLLKRKEDDFRFVLHRLMMKAFYPSIPLSKLAKTQTIGKGEEKGTVDLPSGILICRENLVAPDGKITLREGCPYSVQDLKEVLQLLAESRTPTMAQLAKHYVMLNELQIEPYLYLFHKMVAERVLHDKQKEEQLRLNKQIDQLVAKNPIEEMNPYLKELWNKVAITDQNICVAITFLEFGVHNLEENCLAFIEKYFFEGEKSLPLTVKRANLFRDIYEIVAISKSPLLLYLCRVVAFICEKEKGYSIKGGWSSHFECPSELRNILQSPPELPSEVVQPVVKPQDACMTIVHVKGAPAKPLSSSLTAINLRLALNHYRTKK